MKRLRSQFEDSNHKEMMANSLSRYNLPKRPGPRLDPPSQDACTLFVGNLPVSASHEDILKIFPSATKCRKREDKSYAFVSFPNFSIAKTIVESANVNAMSTSDIKVKESKQFTLQDKLLTLGWANTSTNSAGNGDGIHDLHYNIGGNDKYIHSCNSISTTLNVFNHTAPSPDATCLFISPIPHPDKLCIDDFKNELGATHIRQPKGRSYGFLEFPNHTLAKQCLERIDRDGGVLISLPSTSTTSISRHVSENEDKIGSNKKSEYVNILYESKVGWAYDQPLISDDDCWFCLGSPTIKTHLIVHVGTGSYITLPRGALHELHALIVPIECVSSRLQLSLEAKNDLNLFVTKIRALYGKMGYQTLIFERTLPTRGKRNHFQTNIVPISQTESINAINTFITMTRTTNLSEFQFHEVTSRDLGDDENGDIDNILLNMMGGPHMHYFYFEIPYGSVSGTNGKSRKFLYVPQNLYPSSTEVPASKYQIPIQSFPLNFGYELVSKILGKTKFRWKDYVLSEEEETMIANNFRKLFTTLH
jgi:RNA recognition motif-containing protein